MLYSVGEHNFIELFFSYVYAIGISLKLFREETINFDVAM